MSPAFVNALEALKDEINLSSGLAHPDDFRKAVEMFQWLLDAGESPDQDAIITYLMDNGVRDDVASEIQRLYETLNAGPSD